MLKPKYVHGVNADEGPKSVLHRLQNDGSEMVWPFDDVVVDPVDGVGGDATNQPAWTWTLG